MATISVNTIKAFDAKKDQIISFTYYGDQVIANTLKVYNNDTGALVYNVKTSGFSTNHILPAYSLINGTSYYCTITAFYINGGIEKYITSTQSSVFQCLDTPIWNFIGITDGQTIGNSTHTFNINYSQIQGETIDEYQVIIYTASNTVFWNSGSLYSIGDGIAVTGLANNEIYYIRAFGVTTQGFALDTRNPNTLDDIQINIDYIVSALYSEARLEQDSWKGLVRITSNFASVEGRMLSGGDAIYVNNSCINLLNDSVVFDEGLEIEGDYVIECIAFNIIPNIPILAASSDNGILNVTFRKGVFNSVEKLFLELRITKISEYVVFSPHIAVPSSDQRIHIWIQRKNGVFELKITNMEVL